MAVYWVAMWTVRNESLADHDQKAVPELLEHMRTQHPRVLTVRTWSVLWGSEPARPGRVWMEELASLRSFEELEEKERTEACDQIWDQVHRLSVPGTFRSAIWTDPLRKNWKLAAGP
jgi:hypothetical protein